METLLTIIATPLFWAMQNATIVTPAIIATWFSRKAIKTYLEGR